MNNNKRKEYWLILLLTLIISILLHVMVAGGIVKKTNPPKISKLHSKVERNLAYKDNQLIVKGEKVEDLETTAEVETLNYAEDWKTFNATGYTAYCDGCTGLTYYKGYDVRNTIYYDGMRVVAVDPNVVKLGSIVEIKYGDTQFKAIALDIGSAINNNDVDILFKTKEEAYQFGVQDVKLRVLRWGENE